MRIDQLLHWLCLEKSRSLAARACREGRVRIEGAAVRPSREVGVGERIALWDAPGLHRRRIEVLALPARQVSRKEISTYYRLLGAERVDPLEAEPS